MSRGDVIVVGGGMVGATAAALLGRMGLEVTVLDARGRPSWAPEAPVGLRVSAISPGSASILEQAGAWQAVLDGRHCTYRRMHVEDGQGSGELTFEAAVFGLDVLGTIVENDFLVHALWDELEASPRVRIQAPARVAELAQDTDRVRCRLEGGEELSARLLLGCDGPGSLVRRAAGIRSGRWDYNQKGVVGRVRKSRPNPGVAWQRFLEGGPLALLPLADGWSSMVWTLPARQADERVEAPEASFREALDTASAGWLGEVEEVGPRAAFPLAMSLGDRFVAGRVVLLGDAAHAIHPLAGQGVNLGLADVAALVERLAAGAAAGRPLAHARDLAEFERWRRSESRLMAGGVHALGALFRPAGLSPARSLGLRLVGRSWSLREAFLRRAAGRGPNAPHLALGNTLDQLASSMLR